MQLQALVDDPCALRLARATDLDSTESLDSFLEILYVLKVVINIL